MGPLVFVGIGLGLLMLSRGRSPLEVHVSGQAALPPAPPIGPASHVSAIDLDHAPPGWLDTWKRTHQPPPGAPPPPEHPHHHHHDHHHDLHSRLPNLPAGLKAAANLALQSGMPHVAAQIADGAMRGDGITAIAQTIAPHLNATASIAPAPPPPDASSAGLLDAILAATHKQQTQQAADHQTLASQQTSPGWGLQPGQHAPTGNWGAEYENAQLRTETQTGPAAGPGGPQYR